MGEVMSPQPRQPAGETAQMNAPVEFFVEHVVGDKGEQRAAAQPRAQPVEDDEGNAIPDQQQDHGRRRAETHVERLLRLPPGFMMPFMRPVEIAGCAVEQDPVGEVLERVPVNQAEQESQRPAVPGKQSAPYKEPSHQKGGGLAAENFLPARSDRLWFAESMAV